MVADPAAPVGEGGGGLKRGWGGGPGGVGILCDMGKDIAAAGQHMLCITCIEGDSKFGSRNMPLWLSHCINKRAVETCLEYRP